MFDVRIYSCGSHHSDARKVTSQFIPGALGGWLAYNLGPRTLLSANLSYFHDHCLTQVLLPTPVAVSDGDGITTHSPPSPIPHPDGENTGLLDSFLDSGILH
jgi:hypothetical protein